MNITGQFERIDFTPIVARARLGTRAMACRGRVIGDEGAGGRLETLAACATGNLSFRATDRLPVTGRDDRCGNAAFFFLRELNLQVRQDAVQYLANSFHRASVASCSVITSHHRRSRKCPQSIRSAVLCLH